MDAIRQASVKKISVCMTSFNGEMYIEEQLNSILHQLRENDEVIISDDGSTDNTIKIIESLKDPRIRLFHSSFGDIVLNFENALKKVTGDIIFLSDQDDIWYDNKVEEICRLLEAHDLIYTNASVFNNEKEKNRPFNKKENYSVLKNFVKNNCLGATMAFNTKLLEYCLPFPKKIPMHDMWIYFVSAFYGKTLYYNKPLIYYRRHGSNASNASEKTSNSIFKVLAIRVTLFTSVFKRLCLNAIKSI